MSQTRLVACLMVLALVPCVFSAEGYINGIPEDCYPDNALQVSSFAQIAQNFNANLSPDELLIRSSLPVQAAWTPVGTSYKLVPHNQFYNFGPFLDFAHFAGMAYHVAYRRGGQVPNELTQNAVSTTLCQTDAESVSMIQTLIQYYQTPVQVYVDFYYLHDEAAEFYLQWRHEEKIHQGRYIVVHGFDDNYIYYTDHCPLDTDFSSPAVGVPILWGHFLEGWYEAHSLEQNPMGPYVTVFPDAAATLSETYWTLLRLSQDAMDAPAAIRACAQAMRQGGNAADVLDPNTLELFAAMRPYMVEYLRGLDPDEIPEANAIADHYDHSASLWQSLADEQDWAAASDLLEDIAEAEEQALEMLYELTVDTPSIALQSPAASATLGSLEFTTFSWLTLDSAPTDIVLQIAVNGNFNNKKELFQFTPSKGRNSLNLSGKDWARIVTKDNGDRALSWRVLSKKQADYTSETRELKWSELKISLLSPSDGYQLYSKKQELTFVFRAPSQLGRPQLLISTTGNFADKKSITKLPYRPRYGYFKFTKSTTNMLKNKDNGDGILFWRIIDAKQNKTTVQPSDIRTLYLP